jgi:AcrR family transcriptional regulator
MPPRSSRSRRPLNRERVLAAAVQLADEAGIESLTMRRLAGTLGVEAMSLYNHVDGKGDLVDSIGDLVFAEIELPDEEADWRAAVRRFAVSAHEVLLRHPWACSLAMGPSETRTLRGARIRYMDWLLRRLDEAGFSPELTYHSCHVLDSYMLGFTYWQLGHVAGAKALAEGGDLADLAAALVPRLRAAGYPYVADHAEQHLSPPTVNGEGSFEFGLDVILEGLERARGTSKLAST